MKALMVNSLDTANIIQIKMRDQKYMKHLRQVQKINNRSPDQINEDIKTYRSINSLHHKHKCYAFDWNNKELNTSIEQNNSKIQKKILQIRSYFHNKSVNHNYQNDLKSKQTQPNDEKNQPVTQQTPKQKSEEKIQKKKLSLHYRYRQKLQYQISLENQRLQKAILSQKSTYHLPRIGRMNKSNIKTQKLESQLIKSQDKVKQ